MLAGGEELCSGPPGWPFLSHSLLHTNSEGVCIRNRDNTRAHAEQGESLSQSEVGKGMHVDQQDAWHPCPHLPDAACVGLLELVCHTEHLIYFTCG